MSVQSCHSGPIFRTPQHGMTSKSMLLLLLLPFLSHHVRHKIRVTLFNLLKSVHRKIKPLLPMSHSDDDQSLPAPPRSDASKPSVPISDPIKTLQDLDSPAYFDSFHYPFNKSRVPLQWNKLSLQDKPRVLVCHDMQGGYVDDKWVQGGSNAAAYAIWHWYLIDVFVYFSHNLVTLPPPCWTNTAHRHGVKVLGTFITEWDEGKVICNQLLSTKESARKYAERLAELADALGFDGWLINMEVALDVGQIPNLKEFVSHLTQRMHSLVRGALVIWYDSVTINGHRDYQNQLNEKNKPFFDICDGIFVNYSWEDWSLPTTAGAAGDKRHNVYAGIDVFKRSGSYAANRHSEWQVNTALEKIKKSHISAAIFAPGWVYEHLRKDQFVTNQNKWWGEVEKSWRIMQKYPKSLPFYSNFDQGRGYHIAVEGRQVSDAPWNNISCQGLQPHLENTESASDKIEVLVDLNEASYNGGGNLTFKGDLQNGAFFETRIFQAELDLGDSPVDFTYSVKSEENSLFGLSLKFFSEEYGKESFLLAPLTMTDISGKFTEAIKPNQVRKPETVTGWILMDYTIRKSGRTLTEINAVCYKPMPKTSKQDPESESSDQENTSASVAGKYHAVLGHITIKNSGDSSGFLPATSWLVKSETIENTGSKLSLNITWELKDGKEASFLRYYIYVENAAPKTDGKQESKLEDRVKYLGVAHVQAFYVSEVDIPAGVPSLKFIIQACAADGAFNKLNDSPYIEVNV